MMNKIIPPKRITKKTIIVFVIFNRFRLVSITHTQYLSTMFDNIEMKTMKIG